MRFVFTNDLDLIKALKNGESKAYTFLINNYHHRLCVYAFSLTNNDDLSEDIVQNVFISIWKHRKNLKDNFVIKSYLYKSVYNKFIDDYRKQKAVLILEKKYIDALTIIIDENSEGAKQRFINLIQQEIENLPPKCKETFLLSKKEGLTNIEISEYLNVSVKAVEAHITKAFSILREKVRN